MNSDEIWDNIKLKVLTLSGIEDVEPKDCRSLSILISKETKKTISETTLKRIFGFAAAPYEASGYTKNILAQYCGYKNWEAYRVLAAKKTATEYYDRESWEKMRTETRRVNFFMLSAVKNKAIIPLSEMIERKCIYTHFEEFDQSGAVATVITAPTGYGKTIAMNQWLEHKLSIKTDDDLVLYLNSSFLLSSLKTVVNLNYWMMKMIGLGPSQDVQTYFFDQSENKGKFYFVIDGFDEWMFRNSQFEVLAHLLQDLVSIYRFSSWFKIVIIMRDSTWLDWKSQLMIDPSIWYVGDMNEQGQNFGLFTIMELSTLMQMERPFTKEELTGDDFIILRFPLFHLYFYKKYNSIIHQGDFNEVLLYELATDYIRQNIIYGNLALQKMDFIFFLIKSAEFIAENYRVDKAKVPLRKKVQLSTYSNLIQIGFIGETEKTIALNKQVYIHFSHHHLLGCCIAAHILKEDAGFSIVKLEYILQHWNKDVKLKTNILKWCLFQSIAFGKREDWIKGYQENLEPAELKKLASFISRIDSYPV
jgi:hypothetical protein